MEFQLTFFENSEFYFLIAEIKKYHNILHKHYHQYHLYKLSDIAGDVKT